jgi:hypothetical protein
MDEPVPNQLVHIQQKMGSQKNSSTKMLCSWLDRCMTNWCTYQYIICHFIHRSRLLIWHWKMALFFRPSELHGSDAHPNHLVQMGIQITVSHFWTAFYGV